MHGGGGNRGMLQDTWVIAAPPLSPPLAYADEDAEKNATEEKEEVRAA